MNLSANAGDLRIRQQSRLRLQRGEPLLCPAPLPDLNPALLVGTIETANAEGQYSAWIMFDLSRSQRLPDKAALVALGWRSRTRSVGPGLSTFMGATPAAVHPDPGPVLPPDLYLHPEARTVLFIRPGLLDQDQQITWQLDTGRSYEHLSRKPQDLLILPVLTHPAGTSVFPLSGTRGESNTLTHSAESVLIAWPGTAAELHTHYAAQLTAAGWADQTAEPSGSTSTWSFDGGAGQGSLTLQQLPDGRILAQLTALGTGAEKEQGNFGFSSITLHSLDG